MKISKYRSKVVNMDRAQLLTEMNYLLDQQEQIWDGTREAIDWPVDGVERRQEIKYSVGPANAPKDEPRDQTYYPDGSVKSFRLDSGTVKRSSPSGA